MVRAKLDFHATFTKIEDFEKRKKLVERYNERLDYENTNSNRLAHNFFYLKIKNIQITYH